MSEDKRAECSASGSREGSEGEVRADTECRRERLETLMVASRTQRMSYFAWEIGW